MHHMSDGRGLLAVLFTEWNVLLGAVCWRETLEE
jgi:hypothetical protein